MKSVKMLYPLSLFMFFSLACGSGLPLSFFAAATPTPAAVIDFEVTIIIPTPTSLPMTAIPSPTPASSTPITSSLPVTTTAAEAQSAPFTNTLPITLPKAIEAAVAFAPAPPPTAVPPTDLAQPVISTTTVSETVTPPQDVTAEDALTGTTSTQPAPPAGAFVLLEPFDAFTLQPGINELEFKWRWAEAKGCQPPEGFGYELRIWPAVTGYSPMGVTDAVKSQQDFYCDPQGNVASYRVVNLKGTPGVAAMGSGKFLWDIAYIQLEPYSVVLSSGSRLFELP